jgi:GDPmannose 4,6-dehydratase
MAGHPTLRPAITIVQLAHSNNLSGVARILAGTQSELSLGNLEAKRDWGHAADYVRAMWLMLQQAVPDDYVVATAETHSVREFAEFAFQCAGLDYRSYVRTDPKLYRPAEFDLLIGKPDKAARRLGWSPSVTFQSLVREMVASDCLALGVAIRGVASQNESQRVFRAGSVLSH